MITMNKYSLIGGAILLFVVLFILYKFLQKINLVDDKEDRIADDLPQINGFDPTYYVRLQKEAAKRKKKVLLVPMAAAKKLSKDIYDAKGWLYDTDEQGVGALRQMKTQSQISFLSKVFFDEYKRDLGSYLDFMSTGNKANVVKFIQKLPKGIV